MSGSTPTRGQTFAERAARGAAHPLAAYLFRLMSIKQTNLCVSADVNSTSALLRLAEEVGDHICVLKTHADIVDDFGERTIRGLLDVARRKRFLLFEDRKFGDIGSTVEQQYVRGPLQIATWAHIVNAHLFAGPAIVTSLRHGAALAEQRLGMSVSTEIFVGTPELSEEDDDPLAAAAATTPLAREPSEARAKSHSPNDKTSVRTTTTIYQTVDDSGRAAAAAGQGSSADRQLALLQLGDPPVNRALLLFAQMSSSNNRMDEQYTAACVEVAREYPRFVLGYVAQRDLNAGTDNFLSFTPGVNLPPQGRNGERATGDGKGQQYRTPAEVVSQDGCDIVIVGRGILRANNRKNEAERYQAEAWHAYEARLAAKP